MHWQMRNTMLYVLNLKKGVACMSILLHEVSLHQIFKMKHHTMPLTRKINAQLSSQLNDPELFELFTKFIFTLEFTGNTTTMNVASCNG